MDPTLFFNLSNAVAWLALGLLIWLETQYTPGDWNEDTRWWEGWLTLFGVSLVMTSAGSWDSLTVAVLALASVAARLTRIERLLVGDLWRRRENHRWTLSYFTAFVVVLPAVIWARLDVLTWGAVFVGLGVCGAVKVGAHALEDSRRAAELRRFRAQAGDIDALPD
jgi:hypothetical protein